MDINISKLAQQKSSLLVAGIFPELVYLFGSYTDKYYVIMKPPCTNVHTKRMIKYGGSIGGRS